jgi:3-oxoacyl-[acyl-carrier protein] reductase
MNILITGGASGLGKAITCKLASLAENNIVFTYNKSDSAARDIENLFPNTKGIHCDFSSAVDLENLLRLVLEFNVDTLVNNAYATDLVTKHFHKILPSVFVDNFALNIIPTIRITQEAIVNFRKKKFGKIINILSSAIVDAPPLGWSEYVAQKAYLASLSKSWAVENSSFNITSNSISPSFMMTDFTSDFDERTVEEIVNKNPLKKLLTVDEVSECVLFFLKSSQQINGINMLLNAATHVA